MNFFFHSVCTPDRKKVRKGLLKFTVFPFSLFLTVFEGEYPDYEGGAGVGGGGTAPYYYSCQGGETAPLNPNQPLPTDFR